MQDVLPIVQPAVAPPPKDSSTKDPGASGGVDGGGSFATVEQARLAETIKRASADAVDQHLSGDGTSRSPRHGKRGPDKKPRRAKVPLAPVGEGAPPSFLAEPPPAPLSLELPSPPPFDEETARALIEIALGLLNDGAAAVVGAIAKKETNDATLSAEASRAVRMSEKVEGCVRMGAMQCAKKYSVRLEYAPEMMLAGGLVIWGGQVALSIKALKEKGLELKAQRKAAADQARACGPGTEHVGA